MAQPRGFVRTEQRADKCRLLLTIYTPLHTPAHVRVTQKCTRFAAVAPLVHFASPPSSVLRPMCARTHAGRACFQCISVNQCKRERWEKPLRAHHSDRNLAPTSPAERPLHENQAYTGGGGGGLVKVRWACHVTPCGFQIKWS